MSTPAREKRKAQPDYVLSVPKRRPCGSDIRIAIHRFGGQLLFDLVIDGEIEHTSRGIVYDAHLDDPRRDDLEKHALAYLRYHTTESLVLTDGEIDQIEEWLGSNRETAPA